MRTQYQVTLKTSASSKIILERSQGTAPCPSSGGGCISIDTYSAYRFGTNRILRKQFLCQVISITTSSENHVHFQKLRFSIKKQSWKGFPQKFLIPSQEIGKRATAFWETNEVGAPSFKGSPG